MSVRTPPKEAPAVSFPKCRFGGMLAALVLLTVSCAQESEQSAQQQDAGTHAVAVQARIVYYAIPG